MTRHHTATHGAKTGTAPGRPWPHWAAVAVALTTACSSGERSGSGAPTPAASAAPPSRLARPAMGWNSWNRFGCNINETLIRQTADSLVMTGLRDAGYVYLTVDDCWSAPTRNGSGDLQADPADFPSGMKALGDYIHARGLKFGLYTSIGSLTCTGKTPGSLNNERRDVETFASWGVDYMKVDRCGPERDSLSYPEVYARYRDAAAAAGRPIVLSASTNGGAQEPWSWGPTVAHQWRTTGDIRDSWTRMLSTLDGNARYPGATVPGAFNDPDMLEVGNGGMSETEYRAHFGMWALMSAPLIAGHDVRSTSQTTLDVLTHPEVLELDRDPLAFQAVRLSDDAGLQVWCKPIEGRGARAVGLLNRTDAGAWMTVNWTQLGLAASAARVRDLWTRSDQGSFSNGYSAMVPSHGLALLRIVGEDAPVVSGPLGDQTWTYVTNGFGPVERDRSVGGSGTGDGRTITLNGTTYTKGLGVHAPSAIELRPNGACQGFRAEIGVDDEVGGAGNVIFQVWADGNKLYDSGVMTGATETKRVDLDISGRTSLRLQVAGGTDTLNSDHADWADARVTCGR